LIKRAILEKWLNDYFLIDSVPDYLPNGMQIEGKNSIKRIITGVSINLELIETAVSRRADAIIVHHGMFWKNDEKTIKSFRKDRIKKILENDINLFAYHLPLDVHPRISHNRIILKNIGASVINSCKDNKDLTFGLKGNFDKPIGFNELLERINNFLNTKARFYKFGIDYIKSIYVVSGAGRNEIEKAFELSVDAYLTGDANEGTKYLAKESKLNYIYAGHYNTERPGIIELSNIIRKEFDIEVKFIDIPNEL